MLQALTLILLCQLLGEAAVLLLGLPLPGPVLGMLLLFAILLARGGPPESVARTADTLLAHLPLLFVPAGVGVMLHWELLRSHWPALLAAVLAGTLLTLAATALTLIAARRLLDRWRRPPAGAASETADASAPETEGKAHD